MRFACTWLLIFAVGCGSASKAGSSSSSGSTGTSGGSSGSSGGTSGGSVDAGPVLDPTQDGPYAFTEFDSSYSAPGESSAIAVHVAHPSSGGPYPLVVVAHGFVLPASEYASYARRLASFGYVAVAPDYPNHALDPNHELMAHDLLAAIDWAKQQSAEGSSPLAGQVDDSRVGITGHSLGGKLSILAASEDARVKALLALDPVDSSGSCTSNCPTAASKLPLAIPIGFLGETTDATAGSSGQACAPAADNFQSLYALTAAPSFAITVNGANHMSFVDDTSCFACGFCNPATASHDAVLELARAEVVAFYEQHLRGNAGYAAWTTGANAQARWADGGFASFETK